MFCDNPSQSGNHKMLLGRIVAGSLDEEFRSAIGYWSADDYRRQWASAIDSNIKVTRNKLNLTHWPFRKPKKVHQQNTMKSPCG
jgi:hypothetical protein